MICLSQGCYTCICKTLAYLVLLVFLAVVLVVATAIYFQPPPIPTGVAGDLYTVIQLVTLPGKLLDALAQKLLLGR